MPERASERSWIKGTNNKLLLLAIAIGLIAIAMSSYTLLNPPAPKVVYINGPQPYNITGSLLVPPTSLSSAPVVAQNESFGSRLTNINSPLNASELAVINYAPASYFETAGEMFLNGSINNSIGAQASTAPMFMVNGKPSVIYLGSITCIFCGENRWAMALALSRFGNFTYLFKGYSSFGDGDLPTLYWAPAHYNQSAEDLGNFYSSRYINFISIEDAMPITQGFDLNPMSTIQQRVNATGNTAYMDALAFIIETKDFAGTPFTVWGPYVVGGADGIVFGNSTPTSAYYPIAHMTHAQVLAQFAKPDNQFAWSEYAAADYYVALLCKGTGNTAPVCSLPAIQGIEAKVG